MRESAVVLDRGAVAHELLEPGEERGSHRRRAPYVHRLAFQSEGRKPPPPPYNEDEGVVPCGEETRGCSSFDFGYPKVRLVVAGALLALAGGLLGGGCSTGFDYPTQQDFCQAAAQVDCSGPIVGACFGSATDTSTQRCVSTRTSPEVCNPGQLTYHPEAADGCIAAHQALYANNVLDPTLYQQMQQACLPVFNKGQQTGVPCSADSDCDVGSGLYCIIHQGADTKGTFTGTCQVPNPVPPGSSCDAPAAQCVDQTGATDTFYCAFITQTGGHDCIANPTLGHICGSDVPCAAGLYCEASTGTCAQPHGASTPCNADGECVGGFCLPTSATSGICADQNHPRDRLPRLLRVR